ncbi:MAG: class I SAM-dependent methyltransferase [Halopseudomonas sp.]
MSPSLDSWLSIWPQTPDYLDRAEQLAERLQLRLQPIDCQPQALPAQQALLCVGAPGLALQQAGKKAPGPVRVDFLSGTVAHRRRFGGGAGQQIAKAIGIKSGIRPVVADLTAGLGRDSFVLATLGCQVQMVERTPVVGLLLEDGLARASYDPEVGPIIASMSLHQGDGAAWLTQLETAPEVIYLDPMFPHSAKSAQVKKEMLLFRDLVGEDADADVLLEVALSKAQYRVVVKRPRKAPTLNDRKPSFCLEGKSGRFDVYSLKALR